MKKILSLVLSCSLVLGSFGMAFASPADVEGTKYEDSVTRLSALEVLKGYEDNTFKPEKTITRAEFAKIMANVTGVGTAAEYAKGQTKFADVAADHWAAGYINVVSDMGIINGYGDGNFGPQDQVTYAQAVTMIVRALGYTPKANAMGGYPGGYLAVAAEKEITDDVSVVSTLAATRGDVAIMVNNSLTVDLMEQITYGQYPEYKEVDGKNLMTTKLDVEELEGRVVAIPDTDSSLDDDEIILAIEDEDNETLTMKVNVDYMTLLGLEVTAWADGDDVFFLEIETDDKDVIFDTVDTVDADEIELLVDGDAYEFDADVEVYINYEEEKVKDIDDGMYGYVVLNKKDDVIAVNMFDFEVEGELVTEVDGEDVELEGSADLDLEDYDDGVYVFDKNFKTVDVDTVKADSVVSYYADGDEIWLVVVNETVEGTLERASDDEIKVAGEEYDVRTDMLYSLDNKDDMPTYDDPENLDDLMEEEVVVLLDLNGYAKLVTGDVKETSGTMYALWLKGYDGLDAECKVLNTAGEKVVYKFEDDDDLPTLPLAENTLVAFEINKDGEIAEGTFETEVTLLANIEDDYDVVTLEVLGYNMDDDGYIEENLDTGAERFYVEDDTVFFNIEGGDGEELAFADIEDVDDAIEAAFILKEKNGNDLVAVVLVDAGEASKDELYGIVTEEPDFDGDWKVTIDVAGEGKVEYAIGGSNVSTRKAEFTEGAVLSFKLNTDNEIKTETFVTATEEVTDVNGKYFELDGDWIKVATDRVIYLLDDGDIDKKLDYDDIDENDNVYFIKDSDDKIAVIAVASEPEEEDNNNEQAEGIVSFATDAQMAIDGNTYKANEDTKVLDADDDIIGLGSFEAISIGDKISIDGDEYTIVMTEAEVEAAAIAAVEAATDTDALATALASDYFENVITANMQAYLDAASLVTDVATINAAIVVVNDAQVALASFAPVTLTQTGTITGGNVQYADADAVKSALPAQIEVTLVNGSTVDVPVTWDDTDTYNAGVALDYTFTAVWGAIPAGANDDDSLAEPTVEVTVAP